MRIALIIAGSYPLGGGMLPRTIDPTFVQTSRLMISAVHRKMLLPILVMLLALSGMSLSAVGEASSHGLAELVEESSREHHDHSHSHDELDTKTNEHVHHDSSNHSHESVDHPTIHTISGHWTSVRQLPSLAVSSPRSFRYRLERPPKAC